MKKIYIFIIVIIACITNVYSQNIEEVWRKRVNEQGYKPIDTYYFYFEDKMRKWMFKNGWDDEIVDIKSVEVKEDGGTRRFFVMFKTKNTSEPFYANCDDYDYHLGEYFLVSKPYPKEFQEYLDKIVLNAAEKSSRMKIAWESMFSDIEQIIFDVYLPRYDSLLLRNSTESMNNYNTKKEQGLKEQEEWKMFYNQTSIKGFTEIPYQYRDIFEKSEFDAKQQFIISWVHHMNSKFSYVFYEKYNFNK